MIEAILSSQSRYIQQADFWVDINQMATNTINQYGFVDVSDNVLAIFNQSNRIKGSSFVAPVPLTDTLTFVTDGFGVGENSMTGFQDYLIKMADFLQYNWDDEFWVAFKFKTNATQLGRAMFSTGDNILSHYIDVGISNGNLLIIMDYGVGFYKRLHTVSLYNDNITKDVIFHIKGTDDIADCDIIVNGVNVATTVISNDTLVGQSFVSNDSRVGRSIRGANGYVGDLGNFSMGRGTPNIPLIRREL